MPAVNSPVKESAPKTSKIVVWVILALILVGAAVAIIVAQNVSRNIAEAPGGTPTVSGSDAQSTRGSTADLVVRENSVVLSKAKDEKAVLVEFLDYECESCGAAYPFVEELRAKYGDTVTFVHRYFPLPGHRNSMTAALAVEAAAQQGAYEGMYKKMFETQREWGESADNKSAVFRGFAEELKLDMAAFDKVVADPATQARIEADKADGEALGVAGTPTFYLDGKLLRVGSVEEFDAAVAATAAD